LKRNNFSFLFLAWSIADGSGATTIDEHDNNALLAAFDAGLVHDANLVAAVAVR